MRSRRTTFWNCVTALFVVALLWTRIAGAHMHYCFDGAEPAAAVHVMDMGLHADAPCERSGKAINEDVDQDDSVSVKVAKTAFKIFVLPSREIARVRTPSFSITRVAATPVFTSSDPSILRPPLRGPPSLSPTNA